MAENLLSSKKISQANEISFRKLLSKIPDLIFQVNFSESGEIYFPFFNKAVISYFELTQEEIRNFDLITILSKKVHPDDYPILFSYLTSNLDKENLVVEFRAILPQKGLRWFKIVAHVEQKDNNYQLFGRLTDISKRKEQEKIQSTNFNLITDQNSRLLNFAHIVSHNLRSHACNFKMLLELANDESDDISLKELLTHLTTSSNALSQTIDHLKELVDIQTSVIHKKENLNLNLFLDQTIDILAEEIKKNKVKINKNIPKNYCLSYNPSYLESILLNFTTNAIKYSHPDRIPEINYNLEKIADNYVLSIADNGLGIDLERHGQKLFGMYKTFHNNANARGIGLFITKNQIEAMGGKVEVESTTNIGTTFKIYFSNEI